MAGMTDQDRLAALEDAYYSGVLQVSHGDRMTRYRSMEELAQAIALLKEKLGHTPRARSGNRMLASFSKGL